MTAALRRPSQRFEVFIVTIGVVRAPVKAVLRRCRGGGYEVVVHGTLMVRQGEYWRIGDQNSAE